MMRKLSTKEPYRLYLERIKREAPHDPLAVGRLFIEAVEEFAKRDSPCAVTAQEMMAEPTWPPVNFDPERASDASTLLYRPDEHPVRRWSHIKTFYGQAVRRHRKRHCPREDWGDLYEGVPIVKIPPVAQSHASRRHMSPSRTTLLHFCAENCKTRGDKFDKAMELLQSITRVSRHTLPPWDQDKLFEIEEMYERSLETKVIPNPIPLPTGLRISG